jgi:hypothetical protein
MGSASPSRVSYTAQTDSEGKFAFSGLKSGSYQITAERDNYQYNPARPRGTLALTAGGLTTALVLKMTPLGIVAGVIRDSDGDPVQNAQVSLMSWRYDVSGRQLVGRGSALTNDLGEYRLFGVRPGRYYLRASPPSGTLTEEKRETYLAAYYPSGSDPAGAAELDVRPGQEVRGADFMLPRGRAVAVRGRVVPPAGATGLRLAMTLSAERSTYTTTASVTEPEGKFEWRGLTPGSYTLIAQATVGGRQFTARHTLQAGTADIDNVELRPAAPLEIKGAIRIEGVTNFKASQIAIRLDGRYGRGYVAASSKVGGDGSFTIAEIEPDLYRITASPPENLFLKSLSCGNEDVTESGIDLSRGVPCDLAVTVGVNGGRISVLVNDEGLLPAPGAQVTLVPRNARRPDLFKTAAADPSGHCKLIGIAPGDYTLYAWETADIDAIRYDPDFLKPYAADGKSITIREGRGEDVTLKLIPMPEGQ